VLEVRRFASLVGYKSETGYLLTTDRDEILVAITIRNGQNGDDVCEVR